MSDGAVVFLIYAFGMCGVFAVVGAAAEYITKRRSP